MGVLARQISLEVIPVCLLVVYAGLVGFYLLAARSSIVKSAPVTPGIEPAESAGR
jgi:hypothetical protein